MLPRILNNFNLFVDGRGYQGRVDEIELPKLNIKTEEYRGGGTDASVDIDMGMEKLECVMTLSDYSEEVISLLGGLSANVPVTVRGSIQRQGEAPVAVVVKMTGFIKGADRGSWQAGTKATNKFTFAARSYSETVGGKSVVEIDILNMKRIINGVDQLAGQRAALGI